MKIEFSTPDQYGRFDVILPGIVTIKGCKHMVSDKWNFIAMPQYLKRNKDGEVVNNSKTGKPLYVADFTVDKAMEAKILAAWKDAHCAPVSASEDQDIPF